MVEEVFRAAQEASSAGLSVVAPREDGSKAPDGPWRAYRYRRPTSRELARWYPGRNGIGIVSGPASGHVQCWDFDDVETYDEFVRHSGAAGFGALVARIEGGYCDQTPRPGIRWLLRHPTGVRLGRGRLAGRRRSHDNGVVKTLIECPTYAIVAPSDGRVHPSGKPYERVSGSFGSIAVVTAAEYSALVSIAGSFDEMSVAIEPSRPLISDGNRPGDDFNRRGTWTAVLEPRGWTRVAVRAGETYWRRPGKRGPATSATTNYAGSDLLYVFSTSTVFESGVAYSKFAAYAVLSHHGDFHAAAADLASRGYGRNT